MAQLNIFLENNYSSFKINETEIYNAVVKMADFIFAEENIMNKSCLADCSFAAVVFDIVFMNNNEIKRINNEYRNKDMPTDVITFSIFADSPKEERFIIDNEVYLGEIMISLDRIKEQAEENNIDFKNELFFVISHGILHLLGFDHQTEKDYNFMVDYQNKSKALVL